jgi:uncharacterized protein (TIGR03086 family)
MPMETASTTLLENALDETARLVDGVRPEQWDSPTPCTDWSVRDLVNHTVTVNRYVAALVRGEEINRSAFAGDHLGENPAAAYRDSAQELLQAFQRPGALDRTYSLPIGQLPGPEMVALRLVEIAAHGWDLARATGQTPDYPPEAVQTALAFTERMPLSTAPGGPFAPPTQPGPNVSDLDRLAALLGRRTE